MPRTGREMTNEERAAHSQRIKDAYKNNPDYYKRICEHLKKVGYHNGGLLSIATREKMSESAKRRHKEHPMPKEVRDKMSASAKKRSTPEYRDHIRDVLNKRVLEGHGEKIRASQKVSPKVKEFKKAQQRKWADPSYRERKILEWFLKNKDTWYGSVTYPSEKWLENHKYCHKWNPSTRERVRAFFGYQCVICGTPQNGKGLDVHHVNERKDACCNPEVRRLFVALCPQCHGRTRKDPPYWKEYFTNMIDNYYGGKCYFEREEYWQLYDNLL
jgi:hypothetical protein